MIPTDSNEAHLPTPRYGQYLTHAHNHIKGATAVHGCHCPGDMVVRMGKVLVIPRSW